MLHYTHVRTAVIVATYDQPRWLDLALRAWARQELRPSFVVVADDGSGAETAEVVRRWGAEHVRRERDGGRFGKCPAVNAAVRRARELGCELALFTDGDCLPAASLLARHAEVARPGRFAAGGVVRLPREASAALTGEAVDAGAFESGRGGDKRRYALPGPAGRLIELASPRRTPWKGGNSSAFLGDVLRVNGYDERFGWGSEDKELGERLENAGVRGYSIRYTAPVFHLWHDRPYVDPVVIARNRALLAETRRTHSTWTPSGIHKEA
jgi:glycosyltransferase involved in cell wall biosynthesis